MSESAIRLKHTDFGGRYVIHLSQANLDGMRSLLDWLDGYVSAKGGTVPGSFELTMHYRELSRAVREPEP